MAQQPLVGIRRPTDEFERDLDALCEWFKDEMRRGRAKKRGKVLLIGSISPDGSISDESYIEGLRQYPLKKP